jgi:hypothetical protein
MAQAVNELGLHASAVEQDNRQRLSLAGWLGVVLVVVAASTFIIYSPRSPSESSRKSVIAPDAGRRPFSPAESAQIAVLTMEALWGRAPKDPAAFGKALTGTPDFLAAGQRLGLQAKAVQITPSALLGAKYPIILFLQEEPDVVVTAGSLVGRREKGEPRYVVFEKVRGNDAVILDPRVGQIVVPVPDLVESVAETGTVWMPNP